MKESKKSGVWGEIYTARYLHDNKYKVISGNYRTRLGELDLIASKDGYLCFIEVKTRAKSSLYAAKEAVDYGKQKRIVATSKLFMRSYPNLGQPRYDVCEVYLDENFKPLKINYIENAFTGAI